MIYPFTSGNLEDLVVLFGSSLVIDSMVCSEALRDLELVVR